MFITVGIVATLAIAGYLGYKNKEQVFWNGVKIYDTIKDYCNQLRDHFKIKDIVIYNGETHFTIHPNNWEQVPFYLSGLCDKDKEYFKNATIGLSYILKDQSYCKIYSLSPDDNSDSMIEDIHTLKDMNNLEKCKSKINFILSATYFNGVIEIDVTELVQMFDVNGDFYTKNTTLSFNDILEWNKRLTLANFDTDNKMEDRSYIELVNLYGDFKIFNLSQVLKFDI
jgi:hypothetical protein